MRECVRGNPRVLADITAAIRGDDPSRAPAHDASIIRTVEAAERSELIRCFTEEARAVGMFVTLTNRSALLSELESIIQANDSGPVLLESALSEVRPELLALPRVQTDPSEQEIFDAPIGIVSAAAGIAETGSIARFASNGSPRSFALVPWTLIVVLEAEHIVPDLHDWISSLDPRSLASEIVLITGPSKSADIGMQLVTGVHGPGEVRILLMSGDSEALSFRERGVG